MNEEMNIVYHNGTWTLVDLLVGKNAIGYTCVFMVKVNPDNSMAQLKAHLAAKAYAQAYGTVYFEIFSLVAKLTFLIVDLFGYHN
ncbi:hypothetical protein L6164_005760 [Bauhinia variegata]|uniref:Uncharacterized protein n=1 Tax=Bauhinia variegata TaxID=167791 RepID=A0ACB9PV05_BAUVA|nr:hypothetical protein L6164_005760 [Bauhinia variegata]